MATDHLAADGEKLAALRENLERVIYGKTEPIEILTIALLAVGTANGPAESDADGQPIGVGLALLGIAAAALAGAMFATMAAAIRYATNRDVPIPVVVVTVTGMGVLCCGCISLDQVGPAAMIDTPPNHLVWMLIAGLFNVGGFLLITKGLQLTALVHANVLNASQVAMTALAGIYLFNESNNPWVSTGIVLTLIGIFQVGGPAKEQTEQPPS